MPKREWKLFIEDILDAIFLIQKYVKDMDFEKFKNDRKTIDAVVRNLEIVGEAVRFLPDNIKQKYPEIDWKGMIGFRNRIAHAYFNISIEIVWHIVEKELPELKEKMKPILEKKNKLQ